LSAGITNADPRGAAVAAVAAPGAPLLLEQLALGRPVVGSVVRRVLGNTRPRRRAAHARRGRLGASGSLIDGIGVMDYIRPAGPPIDDPCGGAGRMKPLAALRTKRSASELGILAESVR